MSWKDSDTKEMLESNDAIIRLRPNLDETGEWDGSISIALAGIFDEDSNLNNVQRAQLMALSSLMAASLPVMEENDMVYEALTDHVDDVMPDVIDELMAEMLDSEEEIAQSPTYTSNGKVITLTFDTKTEGSA